MNPFDAPLDEAQELQTLQNALRMARGFKLFFVVCNDVKRLNEILTRIKEKQGGKLYPLPIECRSLYTSSLRGEGEKPLLVTRIDAVLSGAPNPAKHPFIANLNATRNAAIQNWQFPIVLGVGDYAFKAIASGAPDFFSVRSGVFWFEGRTRPVELPSGFQYDLAIFHAEASFKNLLEAIENAKNQANPIYGSIALLYRLKASELISRRLWREAEKALNEGLPFVEKSIFQQPKQTDLQIQRAIYWLAFAKVFRRIGERRKAKKAYKEAFSALSTFNRLSSKNSFSEIDYYLQRASDHLEEGQFVETEELVRNAEKKLSLMDDEPAKLEYKYQIYLELGVLFQNTGRLVEAEQAFRAAIETQQVKPAPDIGRPLTYLAILYAQIGRMPEAAEQFRAATQFLLSNNRLQEIGLSSLQEQREAFLYVLQHWAEFEDDCDFPERAATLRQLVSEVELNDLSRVQEVLDSIRQETNYSY